MDLLLREGLDIGDHIVCQLFLLGGTSLSSPNNKNNGNN